MFIQWLNLKQFKKVFFTPLKELEVFDITKEGQDGNGKYVYMQFSTV